MASIGTSIGTSKAPLPARAGGGSRAIALPDAHRPEVRLKVFRKARRHTIFVRLLRYALPLAALGSAGLYFTRATVRIDVGPGQLTGKIPTFSGDNLKMEDPRYEGFTNEGGKFTVTAKTGYQDFRNPGTIKLVTIDSHLTQVDDRWSHLVSDDGIYDTKAELLKLSGNIKVTTNTGMTAFLKTADVQTKAQIVTTTDPVRVEMRNGSTVDADRMRLDAKSKEVVFEGNVRSHLVRTQPEAVAKDGAAKPAAQSAATKAVAATDSEEVAAGTAPDAAVTRGSVQ